MKEVTGERRKFNDRVNYGDHQRAKQKNNSPNIVSSGSYLFTFILLIVTLLIYDVILTSENIIDIEAVKRDLVNNVHNQTEALSVILECLSELQNHEKSLKIVNFFGSTGVGKTYIANILKHHFYPSTYELNAFFDSNMKQNILSRIKQTNHNYLNLVVIDDLIVDDVDKLLGFLEELPPEFVALVICVFNIQETDDDLNHKINYGHVDRIVGRFDKAEITHRIVKFHEFDKNQARDWVVKQLELKQVNPQLYSEMVESVLSGHDVKYHGLKGLSSKINLKL